MANTPAKNNGLAVAIGLGVNRWLAADCEAKHLTDDKARRYFQPRCGGHCTPQSGCGSVA